MKTSGKRSKPLRIGMIALGLIIQSLTIAHSQAHTRVNLDGTIREVDDTGYQRVRLVLQKYKEGAFNGDVALFKLAIDKAIEPATSVSETISKIDAMVVAIQQMAGQNPDEATLLNALQNYVYEAGEWNQHNPFTYDHDDPLGTNIENKLLSTYLRTRRGNCVSMPTLVLILGRRLGLNMTMATAPNHVFVMFKAKGTQDWINLEATSGANPARPEYLRANFPMTDQSIQSGLYMRPLGKDELAANIAATAVEDAYGNNKLWDTILIAEALRALDDRNLTAILFRGSALNRILDEDWHNRWPNPNEAPQQHTPLYRSYAGQRDIEYRYASRLGYVPEAEASK